VQHLAGFAAAGYQPSPRLPIAGIEAEQHLDLLAVQQRMVKTPSSSGCEVPCRGWVWPTYDRMKVGIAAEHVVFGPDETTIPGVRRNLFGKDEQVIRSVIFSYAQKATQDFARIFGGLKVFENPKSHIDMARLIKYLTEPGDIVLDFFACSGRRRTAFFWRIAPTKTPRQFIRVQGFSQASH
jgi:adenine-specific DNA-methyltransferase